MKTLLILIISMAAMDASAAEPKGSTGGRFQVIQISEFRRDQYLIDTQTGRLWSRSCAGPMTEGICNGFNVWEEEIVEGINWTRQEVKKAIERANQAEEIKNNKE